MIFESERLFESHIRELMKTLVITKNDDLILFKNKKAVDILICKNGRKPELFFIEIKYHKYLHGRLSTGQGQGGGFQPEILKTQPKYFEKNMRWILGYDKKEGYWVLKNSELVKYLSGGGISEKYNNIQTRVFSEKQPLTEKELVSELSNWLL